MAVVALLLSLYQVPISQQVSVFKCITQRSSILTSDPNNWRIDLDSNMCRCPCCLPPLLRLKTLRISGGLSLLHASVFPHCFHKESEETIQLCQFILILMCIHSAFALIFHRPGWLFCWRLRSDNCPPRHHLTQLARGLPCPQVKTSFDAEII